MEPGHARVLNTCPSRPCDRPSDGSPEVMFDRVILTNIRHRRATAAPTSAQGRTHPLLLEDDFFFLAAPPVEDEAALRSLERELSYYLKSRQPASDADQLLRRGQPPPSSA